MRITVLVENTPRDASIKAEHGLSFFIEAGGKKILLDAGQRDLFLENAAFLGRDLSAVDFAVLSHGHGDHYGRPGRLQGSQSKRPHLYGEDGDATLLCPPKFGFLYFNVGMDRSFVSDPGIVLLDEDRELAPGIEAIAGIPRKADYLTTSSNLLHEKRAYGSSATIFRTNSPLSCGKAIRPAYSVPARIQGLHNIMGEIAEKGLLVSKNHVFAGMHLYRAPEHSAPRVPPFSTASPTISRPSHNTTYYAGHCTGAAAFAHLKTRLGDRIQPLRCGDVFEL